MIGIAPLRTDALSRIQHLLSRGRVSFPDIVRELDGVHPLEVMECLRELEKGDGHSSRAAARAIASAGTSRSHHPVHASLAGLLPTAHPLDAEWRFSDATADLLTTRALKSIESRCSCLLLGTPTVFGAMMQRDRSPPVTLLDASARVVSALRAAYPGCRAYQIRVGVVPRVKGNFSVIIADPPWYPMEMKSFVSLISVIGADKSTLLLSAPPSGVRPTAAAERRHLLQFVRRIGWTVSRIERGQLDYVTPFFEWNAMSAAGVRNVALTWRRGDLITLTRGPCSRLPGHAARPLIPRVGSVKWIEVQLGTTRLKIRASRSRSFRDPRLCNLIDGDIVTTVSRRSPVWRLASIVTSGNRIFGSRGSSTLAVVARAVAGHQDAGARFSTVVHHPLPPVQLDIVRQAAEQLRDMARREAAEFDEYRRLLTIGKT